MERKVRIIHYCNIILYIAVDVCKIIRIHSNPFIIDFASEYQHKNCWLYGNNNVMLSIMKDIATYAASPEGSVWVLAIKGPIGSGKSLFVRNLI
jgi:hypothetical protein